MSDLIEAANILSEYKELNSLVDIGNLYFAATEYQTAYTALEAKLERATKALNEIAILGAGSNAYTSAFTEQVNQIARRALEELEKK